MIYLYIYIFFSPIRLLIIQFPIDMLSFCVFTDDRAREAFYVGPPAKDKLPKVLHQLKPFNYSSFKDDSYWLIDIVFLYLQGTSAGSVLVGAISYGKVSFGVNNDGKNPEKNPASYSISYIVPPAQVIVFSLILFLLFTPSFCSLG